MKRSTAPVPKRKLHRLLVVSHVVHYQYGKALHAYGPYTREIDIWADLFPEVVVAAPCRNEKPPGDCLPFVRANISIRPQPETGGSSVGAKIYQLLMLPYLIGGLSAAMAGADAIHVRCPGNLGLLGAALAPLFSRFRVAKYAGQWNGYEGEPVSVRLQRALLGSRWWGSPVTVYGQWPGQAGHVVPFFTSMMTASQQRVAEQVAAARLEQPHGGRLRVLFAGSLVRRKRVDALLDAVKLVVDCGIPIDVRIVGDGVDGTALRQHAVQLGLADVVTFVGALPFDESMRWYEWADCLVLPSTHSEGWPKVIAEAMSHGLICVAVAHGQIPTMLANRGLLLPTGHPGEIAEALERIQRDPAALAPMRGRASKWATQHSLEGLRDALARLLADRWGVPQESLGVVTGRLEVRS